VCDDENVARRTEHWAARVTRMPADGLAIAKTGFNLVEQTQSYIGEEATGYLMHAFATNLRFEEDEFNFVKTRAKHGTGGAFKLRDEHFAAPDEDA
jgi:enoyl-CoA hydratase